MTTSGDSVATGEGELVVSELVDPGDLRRLLESLVHEDCVHSWRNFGPDGTVERLLAWENARRPTRLFFFYLRDRGERRMVAASAVADRITREFPYAGFCVLGRCCILPEFRSRGFYRRVLSYRLEHCRARLGEELKAIHIGAVNERISRVITHHELAGWPRFLHLGEEALHVAGEIRKVGAYLLLLPGYLRRLQAALAGAPAPGCVVELRQALTELEPGPTRNLGMLIKHTFEHARSCGWFEDHDPRDLEQLLVFCRAIPLEGFG